ncbi:DNA-binding protein YbaB [Streptosporangium lutulentum]|uniref:DNA-binding protein YbaB n=2 Tax=Streptosporangium lutulentum TaxID=1461250 RepID=A0ABT9QGJ8_9ACTN|nr:YbaB/EbfC family nucleoid-associated protein [Streptosporangium lutulentum]MDP9845888.1 DNA-binding protein YbaB [Streptosporangium lutulentum]
MTTGVPATRDGAASPPWRPAGPPRHAQPLDRFKLSIIPMLRSTMKSPMEALRGSGDEELDRLLEQFGQEVTGLEELQERIAGVRGRGEAARGHVAVEASPAGALTSLTIDPRAMRLGSAELAAAILQAAGEAARDAEKQVKELVNPYVADTLLETVLPSHGE